MAKKIAKLQLITQDHNNLSHTQMAQNGYNAGAIWVQLRVKDRPARDWEATALEIRALSRKSGTTLIVNDNVAMAKKIGADGVHLGKTDMSPTEARKILGDKAIIGGTANDMDDIRRLADQNVDYIGLGPFRFTKTKNNLSPVLGIEGYKNLLAQCQQEKITLPIIAIGGIMPNDVPALMATGIHGIAVASAINLASDPQAVCRTFLEKIDHHKTATEPI